MEAALAVAAHFGRLVDLASSLALIAFGLWIAVGAWLDRRRRKKVRDHSREQLDKTNPRTALLLILGSSPMVEGIPAFFAAGKYGLGLILVMSVVFAASTIATYVFLCAFSTAGLQKVKLGAFENYGEIISGTFIALVGIVFWFWPVL